MDVQNQFTALAVDEGPLYALYQTLSIEDGVEYEISLPAGMQVYLSLESRVSKITVSTPDYSKSYDNYNDHLYDLGCFETDSTATVTCEFKEGQEGPVTANLYICSDAYYELIHDKLAESQLNVTEFEDGKIRGVLDSHKDGTLLFSIPYDTGWTVQVDGEAVETYAVGTALMAVDITEGIHEIALDYTAPGLLAGSILSILCILLLLATFMLENKRGWNVIPMQEEVEICLEETESLLYDGNRNLENETGCKNVDESEFMESDMPDSRQ